MDEYRTAEKEAEAEFTERRSRFIGHIRPIQTEEEAVSFLRSVKSKHWDATHNVYAYCLREGQTRRYSDDGEPQGTAGIPVLDVLVKSGVTDAAVVITRYFGGILLGAGGLVRAYSHGASLALGKAGIRTMKQCYMAQTVCNYHQYGRVAALIAEEGGTVDHTDYTDRVTVRFHIACERKEHLQAMLLDATCGECRIQTLGKNFF